MHYVIIGNSVAAVHAVEAIRGVDKKGSISIVSAEEALNYSRPLLSYYLGGRITEDRLSFRDEAFYKRNRVELLFGERATGLDTDQKRVTLADGSLLSYDRLLISVGGVPILPPIEGLGEGIKGVFTFVRLQDAKRLIGYIKEYAIQEAVVLGGGLIGLKVIEGLLERGLRVTVIELMDRILANTFDREASAVLEERLVAHGCTVITGDTIVRVKTRGGKIKQLTLKSGKEIVTSLLIVAVGVRPNLELVQGTPIRTDRGIIVDEFMQTSVPDVYAAGDCAQGLDFLTKKDAVIAIWPVAARQGGHARPSGGGGGPHSDGSCHARAGRHRNHQGPPATISQSQGHRHERCVRGRLSPNRRLPRGARHSPQADPDGDLAEARGRRLGR